MPLYEGILSDFIVMEKRTSKFIFIATAFFYFMNNLPQICSDCHIYLYADDTDLFFQEWYLTY